MRRFGVLCCLCLFAQLATAQVVDAPKAISEAEARQHLVQKAEPIYPPIAQAAQIQGDVVIAVVISDTGRIASEKVLSGPAMLQQAALDAVKKWQFAPFVGNVAAISESTTFTVPFHLEQHGPPRSAEQEKAAQAWFPLSGECRNALRSQNVQDSLNDCKQALDMSFKAGDLTSSDQLARTDSHQLYCHALLLAGRPQEALRQANMAIAEAKKCLTDKDEEYAAPFFWRAIVEAHLGEGDAALSDFAIAEATQRKAILNLPDMKKPYSYTLAAMLKQHAALLDLMGKPTDAAKLRAEAAAL